MKRRDFLRHPAVSAAVLSFPSFHTSPFGQGAREQKGASKRVIIIGAGLAGLADGYELTQANLRPRVDRVGRDCDKSSNVPRSLTGFPV